MAGDRQLFLRYLAQTSEAPLQLEVERAEGVWLYGPDGHIWMDLIAGVAMSPLGHSHPVVIEAVTTQLKQYQHVMVYGEYVLAPQVRLARALCEELPDPLDNVYLVNSGTEATEGAMKLAKRYTGRYEILSCSCAYHGSTQGAMSLMSEGYYTDAYRPLLPGIGHIRFNHMGDLDKITPRTAAVFAETVQAESGITPPDTAWLQALRARCSEMGALLVLDEIQCGYGRTGHLWAFGAHGIVPDILLLGKAMGGGMPIAAFIAPKAIMHTLAVDPVLGHITTFGGHPVSSAAALATLQTMQALDLIAEVPAKASLFKELLGSHPAVRQLRQAGLMMALDLGDAERVQRVIQLGLKEGFVADWFLFNTESIRLSPPLIISEGEIREGCSRLLRCLDAVA
jgi:acetylornithine/succinyldiaminopimelate/putrescine aminotransferase